MFPFEKLKQDHVVMSSPCTTWFLSALFWSEDFHLPPPMGQPFTWVALGWVPISSMSNPHYCLSISCRRVRTTQRRSHSAKCFSHFCSSSFHLSSLTPWQSQMYEDWRSLWLCDSVCHRIASLLRWSNRILRNLMLQLSELNPRRKLNDFHCVGEGRHS